MPRRLLRPHVCRPQRPPVLGTTPDAPPEVREPIPNVPRKKPSGHSGRAHSPMIHPPPTPNPKAHGSPNGRSGTEPSRQVRCSGTRLRRIPCPAATFHSPPVQKRPESRGSHSPRRQCWQSPCRGYCSTGPKHPSPLAAATAELLGLSQPAPAPDLGQSPVRIRPRQRQRLGSQSR